MRRKRLDHQFVDVVPDLLKDGVLYISLTYNTALHKCCCGCGNEVVTPISPVDWTLGYDGQSITLEPSIGNYSFDCKSHYWITHNRVEWVPAPSSQRIEADREADRRKRVEYFQGNAETSMGNVEENTSRTGVSAAKDTVGWWRRTLRRMVDR